MRGKSLASHRTFVIFAGVALWIPLLCSFLGGLTLGRVPGVAPTQLLMVLFLVAATLLLGMLIGKTVGVQD